MAKKYRVTLTADERDELERLLARGKADVRKIKHAQILLKADEAEGGPGWPDARIAEAFAAGITTVERVRQRFVEEGFASALSPYRGGKRIYERKLDGAQEAPLIALACSAPPDGQARWTLRLRRLGGEAQCRQTSDQVAVHNPRCPHQTPKPLPLSSRLTQD